MPESQEKHRRGMHLKPVSGSCCEFCNFRKKKTEERYPSERSCTWCVLSNLEKPRRGIHLKQVDLGILSQMLEVQRRGIHLKWLVLGVSPVISIKGRGGVHVKPVDFVGFLLYCQITRPKTEEAHGYLRRFVMCLNFLWHILKVPIWDSLCEHTSSKCHFWSVSSFST